LAVAVVVGAPVGIVPAVVAVARLGPPPPACGASAESGLGTVPASIAPDVVPGSGAAPAPVDPVAPVVAATPVGAAVVTAVGSTPVCAGTWFTPALHVQPSKEASTPAMDTNAKSGRSFRMGKRIAASSIAVMGTVAVTGAAGFVGSAVVRKLLERGRRVRAVLEPGADGRNLDGLEVERVTADVRDGKRMFEALSGCDTLYHLAAIYKMWMPNRYPIYEVNVEGTIATLLAAQHARVERVVYTSSTVAVGLVPGGIADETTPFNQLEIAGDYTLTKWQSERAALRFAEAGMHLVVVNPGMPFGPRDRVPTPTGRIVLAMLRGEAPPAIGPGGFGTIDVDDCAEGHVLAEEKGRPGERYILVADNVTLKDFVAHVERVTGKRRRNVHVPAPIGAAVAWGMERWADVTKREPLVTYKYARYAMQNAFFSGEKAKRELGLPTRPLEESIRRAVDWFRAEGMAP
jgi:dihydroflavonol-4-reductase